VTDDLRKRDEIRTKVKRALSYFSGWDYRFDLDRIPASIFLAYEFHFASDFQEDKIDSVQVRRCIHGNVNSENFIYKAVA
jgi:acyl-homoserine lactone acylase PvdQ